MRKKILTTAVVLMTCCTLAAWSQEATKATKATAKAAAGTEPKKVTNRLPSNYGKLGLTDAQRDKIYSIQESYNKQLDDLEAQLKSLKDKRDGEIEGVLSVEQKKILKDLNDEAKAKAKKGEEKDK